VKYSNIYIDQQKIMRKGKQVEPLTLGEVYIAHSLMISMAGVHGGPSEEYFWNTPKSTTPPQVAYDFGKYLPQGTGTSCLRRPGIWRTICRGERGRSTEEAAVAA
jgi:hypothetical protein